METNWIILTLIFVCAIALIIFLVIRKYKSIHGDLNMVEHPMFTGAIYGYTMLILDLADDNVEYRPMKNRDTRLKMNIQAADVDGEKHEYLTETGVSLKNVDKHFIFTGIEA